jgi:hypothetical protein
MNIFHDFHARSKFESSLNVMFIALIPKISGAVVLKDFHPIGQVSCI